MAHEEDAHGDVRHKVVNSKEEIETRKDLRVYWCQGGVRYEDYLDCNYIGCAVQSRDRKHAPEPFVFSVIDYEGSESNDIERFIA
jgi:hypothetical protein